MATVTASKKITHSGTIAAANDIHVITLTGPDVSVVAGATDPPYVTDAGAGTVSGAVKWFRVHNPSGSDIRYTWGSSAAVPANPAADGSVDGGYRLPAGATERWAAKGADVVVKLTTLGTSISYDVECA